MPERVRVLGLHVNATWWLLVCGVVLVLVAWAVRRWLPEPELEDDDEVPTRGPW